MASTEFVGEGADVTGKGEDFQNFKMALRAFRIGATCWMFNVLWARVAAAQSPHARGDRCAGATATDSWKFQSRLRL